MVILTGRRHLLEIVGALRPPRRFARGLNRRQQQRHQHADDRDHHEQFDERKTRRCREDQEGCSMCLSLRACFEIRNRVLLVVAVCREIQCWQILKLIL